MVIAPLPFQMLGVRGTVAFEALQLLHLAQVEGRRGLVSFSHGGLGTLEVLTVTFIRQLRGLVGHSPVAADRHGMALVAAAGRRDGFPGAYHGAAA